MTNTIKMLLSRRAIPAIMVVYSVIFILVKNPHDPFDRLIINDGKAYYAYLPALFIYRDLEYNFVEFYESKYYPSDINPGYFKEFRSEFRGQTVNKTFVGIAVLMLPFFLIGHVIALLFGVADGYSMPYQWAIGFSSYFYLWLGLLTLKHLLRRFNGNPNAITLALVSVALGTNLVYYTVVEGTMPHVYLFFLVSLFFLLSYDAIHQRQPFYFIGAAAVFALILITRPQNGFIILALPMLAGSWEKLRAAISTILNRVLLAKVLIVFFSVIMLQIVLWYAQTGYLLVYSYGDERFNFLNPQIFNLLLSYEKGWMVYTPLAFLSLSGLIFLFRKNSFSAVFLVFTFIVLTYVMSSWWVWHYTSQFGQRVYIDFYALLALLLVYGFQLFRGRSYRITFTLVAVLMIMLNIFQFAQHLIWVYPVGPVTKQSYWQNFFRLTPQATVMIPYADIVSGQKIKPVTGVGTGLNIHSLEAWQPSPLMVVNYGHLKPEGLHVLKVHTEIYDCDAYHVSLLFEFFTNGVKYSEHKARIGHVVALKCYAEVETAVILPFVFSDDDFVRLSLIAPEAVEIETGRLYAELITMNPNTDLRWITNPLNSVKSQVVYRCDMETCTELFELPAITDEISLSGGQSALVSKAAPFAAGFHSSTEPLFESQNRILIIEAYTHASNLVNEASVVFSVHRNDTLLFYHTNTFNPHDSNLIWKHHRFIVRIPFFDSGAEQLSIYFWDRKPQTDWYIDDLNLTFVSLYDRLPTRWAFRTANRTNLRQVVSIPDTALIDKKRPFHGPQPIVPQALFDCKPTRLVVNAHVRTDTWFPRTTLVLAHYNGDTLVNYTARGITEFVRKDRWSPIMIEFDIDACVSLNDTLRLYFWNPSEYQRTEIAKLEAYAISP